MLKECRSHGYFREEFCPHCGDEGKFLLNDEEVEILGRTMAGVLRHFPERYGLEMDAHGWVDLRDFLTAVQIRNRRFRFLRQHHVVGLIETDPKGRYQFDDGKTRTSSSADPSTSRRNCHRIHRRTPGNEFPIFSWEAFAHMFMKTSPICRLRMGQVCRRHSI